MNFKTFYESKLDISNIPQDVITSKAGCQDDWNGNFMYKGSDYSFWAIYNYTIEFHIKPRFDIYDDFGKDATKISPDWIYHESNIIIDDVFIHEKGFKDINVSKVLERDIHDNRVIEREEHDLTPNQINLLNHKSANAFIKKVKNFDVPNLKQHKHYFWEEYCAHMYKTYPDIFEKPNPNYNRFVS